MVPVATAADNSASARLAVQHVSQEFAAASLGGSFRTAQVQSNKPELEAAQREISQKLESEPETLSLQTALDPSVNAVVIRVPESTRSNTLAEARRIADSAATEVVVRVMPDQVFEARPASCNEAARKCDLPVRSGQVIYGPTFEIGGQPFSEVCSVGFRANGYDGKKYILTAGHCAFQEAKLGQPINWSWTTDTATEGSKPVGTMAQWHYDGRDWAKIDSTGTWPDTAPWPTMAAYWGGTHEYPIVGEAESYKGQTLCHIGMNTGTSCGIVKEVGVNNIDYGYGAKVGNMFEVGGSGLALGGGDSGGAVVANNIGLGIVSGGLAAYSNATLFFSGIGAANAELNTNLVGPGAPEAITGAPSEVPVIPLNNERGVSGQINPHGLATTYQVEYGVGGFTGTTSPVSVGSGQGFTSVNPTIYGLQPGTTYQYRLKATNSLNSAYGVTRTFKTGTLPTVNENLPTTEISGKQATIRASVNPNNASTTYWFEWGPTLQMGKETPLGTISGLGPVEVKHTLTGLSPATTYYYRVIVANSGGLRTGPTGSFKTGPPGWTFLSRFGVKGTGPGQFGLIGGVAADATGNAYVADQTNHRVEKFGPNGEFLMQFGKKGTGLGEFSSPRSVAIDPQGDVWVGDEGRIQEFTPNGVAIRQIGPNEGTNKPSIPKYITIGASGTKVLLANSSGITEYSTTPNGEGKYFLKSIPYTFEAVGLTTSPKDGYPYFVSREKSAMMRIVSGSIQKVFDIPATTPALTMPAGLAIDSQGNFLISSSSVGSVFQYGATGALQGTFGTKGTAPNLTPGQMNQPSSMALAPTGLLFIGNLATTYPEIVRWAG